LIDWRVEFSKWWLTEFKTIKIPSSGSVFNYFIDPESKQFLPWSDLVPSFELNPDIPLQVMIKLLYLKIKIRLSQQSTIFMNLTESVTMCLVNYYI